MVKLKNPKNVTCVENSRVGLYQNRTALVFSHRVTVRSHRGAERLGCLYKRM